MMTIATDRNSAPSSTKRPATLKNDRTSRAPQCTGLRARMVASAVNTAAPESAKNTICSAVMASSSHLWAADRPRGHLLAHLGQLALDFQQPLPILSRQLELMTHRNGVGR